MANFLDWFTGLMNPTTASTPATGAVSPEMGTILGLDPVVPGILQNTGVGNAPTDQQISDILNDLKDDLTRQNLITLGRDFTPQDVTNYRRRARYGDPRYLYAVYDEVMRRLGPGPQVTVAVEAMKSATAQFLTTPVDWDDDENVPDDASPQDVAQARAVRDFLEDTLSPHLEELTQVHAMQEFYGLADSKLVINPRGNSGRWDAIQEVQEIPARRHRLDATTHQWMLMLSPDSWEGVPIEELLLKPDRGTEGLFFTEIGAGSQHLDQRGLFFQCLVAVGLEQYTVRWRAKYIELFGNPMRMAFVDFAHPNRVAEANAGLRKMGATSYGVFQTGTELKLLEAHTAGANDPFDSQIEWCVRQYDQIILGHSQATGVQRGVGGKMQGDQATQAFEDLTNSRLRRFSSQLTKGLGNTIVARNFGTKLAQQHSPTIRLRFVDRDDPDMLSKVALALFQAGAGPLIGAEDLVRRCTLTVAEGGDKNLGAPVAASPTAKAAAALGADRHMLHGLANADTSEFKAIREAIASYMSHEKKRAVAFGKKKLGRG